MLRNPVWSALIGDHAHLAEGSGLARRYLTDVSPFAAIADETDPRSWRDLAALVGPGGVAFLTGRTHALPAGWTVIEGGEGVQLIGESVQGAALDDAITLGEADVAEMLELVERTQPGPFPRERSISAATSGYAARVASSRWRDGD